VIKTISGKTWHRRLPKIAGGFLLVVAIFLIAWKVLAGPNLVNNVTPDNGPTTGWTDIIITGSGFTDFTPIPPKNYSHTGNCQTFTAPTSTLYRLETWGAQGGTAGSFPGGRGGYSTGDVFLQAGTTVFICVGGQGTQATRSAATAHPGGFNGGGGAARSNNGNGRETASGGGASDIRIGINSLFARVIVAGGGGGAAGQQFSASTGGAGGGLEGLTYTAAVYPGGGGTQTNGGANHPFLCPGSGFFGLGGIPCNLGVDDKSGGGGGWFGGGVGLPGGGGSGFVLRPTSDFKLPDSVSSAVIGGTYLLNEDFYLSNKSSNIFWRISNYYQADREN